jgi:hypothetical protein
MSQTEIFTLPDDVLTSLFVEWGDAFNISVLDSAFCNKTDRVVFLKLLQHKFVVLKYDKMKTTCDHVAYLFMKYIFTRGIKLSLLFVNPFCITTNYYKEGVNLTSDVLSFNIDVSFVQNVHICGDTFVEFVNFADIINSCVNLKQLIIIDLYNVQSLRYSGGFFESLLYLHQFTCIQISEVIDISPYVWQTIANKCTALEHFTFNLDSIDSDYFLTNTVCKDYLIKLLQNNLCLTYIDINLFEVSENGDDIFVGDAAVDLLEVLSNNCPSNIETCKLSCIGTFNIRFFIAFMMKFKNLKTLDITKYDDVHERYIVYLRSSDVKQLHIERFSDQFIEPYSDNAISNIKYLFDLVVGFTHIDFTNMLSFSDKFVCFISKQNLTTLVCLTIGSCGIGFSYASIVECLSICKVLTCLHMLDCPHFSDDDFLELCGPVNNLTELSIFNAKFLTTKTPLMLIEHSKNLLILNVHNCIIVDNMIVDEYCTNISVWFSIEPRAKKSYVIYC